IKVRVDGELVQSTTGRVLLYDVIPNGLPFKIVNRTMGKKQLGDLIDSCYRAFGQKETVLLADRLRHLGYSFATKAGISICVDDLLIPHRKVELLEHAQKDVQEIEEQYTERLITDGPGSGRAATALDAAESGYLARRLVHVAHESIMAEDDRGTLEGIDITALVEGGEIIEKLGGRVLGRVAVEDLFDPYTGEVLV